MIMLNTTNVYEIEFDVAGSQREAFESWLSTEIVKWAGHEAVASFEVFANDQGLSPETKLVFEFETLGDWVEFVDSEVHADAIDRLNGFTETRNAVLWRRDSVRLDGGSTQTEQVSLPTQGLQSEIVISQ